MFAKTKQEKEISFLRGEFLNLIPPRYLIIYKTIFLERNRDWLAMVCSVGVRHRG